MPHPPRFYAFWAINAPLDRERMRRQIDGFRHAGLDGVVFHPRFYPGIPPYLSPEYFALVSDAVLHAKSLGLSFWIYDENGWPSGTVGGELLGQFPADRQCWAGLVAERPDTVLADFDHGGRRWYLAGYTGAGVDYLNPDVARHFIALTYEGYRTGLAPEAFEYVEAFFCDEPEFGLGHLYDRLPRDGAIPWTPDLPRLYAERYGEDLLSLAPALFFPRDESARVRVQFWELLTDRFCAAFLDPLNEWCRNHGKRFTAHIKGEEHPEFQVPMIGSCHRAFQHLTLPGIDALERYPANHFYPRQVSSAARQFGDGRCMAEAFGGAGWGAGPEDLERYLLWLGSHGVTDFVMHLSQYRLDSAAIVDWPPSQPFHLSWSVVYPEVIARVRHALVASPRQDADTLVLAPYRGIMAAFDPSELLETNIHNAATYPDSVAGRLNRDFMLLIENLHRAWVSYDVIDERSFEQCATDAGGHLRVGHCSYTGLIIAEGSKLRDEMKALASTFARPAPDFTDVRSDSSPVRIDRVETTVPALWTLEDQPVNRLALDCPPEGQGWYSARFSCAPRAIPPEGLTLQFADRIAEAACNGSPLDLQETDEGSRAILSGVLAGLHNRLRFRPVRAFTHAFAWLLGIFRVASDAPFVPGPGETLKTAGPFTLFPTSLDLPANLIAGGFPFLFEPLCAVAEVDIPAPSALRLDGLTCDAVRLECGNRDFGWAWRSNGQYRFAADFVPGRHRLRVTLIPNTYNSYGPHHYYLGDWPVISPDQFSGVRNFANPPEAPAQTHVTAWHFRRFELPASITFER